MERFKFFFCILALVVAMLFNSLEMSPSLGLGVFVGIRTEAKPCG